MTAASETTAPPATQPPATQPPATQPEKFIAAPPATQLEAEPPAIAVGPRDLPGAQVSLGIDPPLALNAASSELGPPAPVLPAEVPAVAAVQEEGPEEEQESSDVIKKEGRVDIVPCEEKHLNVGRVCESNFLGIKAGEFRNRKVAAIRSNLAVGHFLQLRGEGWLWVGGVALRHAQVPREGAC